MPYKFNPFAKKFDYYERFTSRVRAYLSADQNVSANVWTKVQYDTVVYDGEGEFDTTNHRFVASNAGYYLAIATLRFSTTALGYDLYGRVYKNGNGENSTFMTNETTLIVPGIYSLNAGDYIEIYVYASGISTSLLGGTTFTNLFIHRLS